MATLEEYQKREAEFAARTDALCENISPHLCDCKNCPCEAECQWLCQNSRW